MNDFFSSFKKYFSALLSILVIGYLLQFIIIFYKLYSTRNIGTYALGEMLINYHCGFLRRGLLGTVLLSISDVFGLNPLVLYKVLCGIIFTGIYAFIIIKLRKLKYVLLLALCLPFGLFFNLNDWSGFGFKDIYILFFYTLILLNQKYNTHKFKWILTLALNLK